LLLATSASHAAGQTLLLEQRPIDTVPALIAQELTGAAALVPAEAVLEDFTLRAESRLDTIRLFAQPSSNTYALVVRVVELSAADAELAELVNIRRAIVRINETPAGDGLLSYDITLDPPLNLRPGVRYGLEARGLLMLPPIRAEQTFMWAAGSGDGDVFRRPVQGSTLQRLEHPGVAFQLIGATLGSSCRADINGDGLVTPTDFSAWVAAFNARLPACDQNSDGLCNPTDFSAFITNFNAGC
jgi:hypothetical protein